MAKEKKIKEVIEREMIANNKEGTFKAQLIRVNPQLYRVDLFKQSTKDVEIETEELFTTSRKRLLIRPDYTDLKSSEIKKRVDLVLNYLDKNSVEDALEQVADKVIKSKNEKEEDTVLNWIPKIEKDLGFKTQKFYDQTPHTEKVLNISTETEYIFKKIETFDFYYRLKPRDFAQMVNNFINQK